MFFSLSSLSGQRSRLKRVFHPQKGNVLPPCNLSKRSYCVNFPFMFCSFFNKVSIVIILQNTKDIIVKKPQNAWVGWCQAAFMPGCYAWHIIQKRSFLVVVKVFGGGGVFYLFGVFSMKAEKMVQPSNTSSPGVKQAPLYTQHHIGQADEYRAVNPPWSLSVLFVAGHISVMLPYPITQLEGCKAHNSPVGPQVGFIPTPLSSSYTKPSVLEWNGSLPLTDSSYGYPWNALVVPKGCHFSVSIPYNFISIWQVLTVSEVGEQMCTETCNWNRKISCKMVGAGEGFNWKPVSKVSSCKLTGKRLSLQETAVNYHLR